MYACSDYILETTYIFLMLEWERLLDQQKQDNFIFMMLATNMYS